MYYGKKKAIIITVIIVLLVLILATGGVLAYFFTDLFKSNETLFYKYMAIGLENMAIPSSMQLQNIANMQQSSPYEVNGELSLGYTPAEETEESLSAADALGQVTVAVTGQNDPLQEASYRKLDLQLAGNSIFEVEYANSNQIAALKSDEIVNAYVGIKNENLKVLAQKLGVQDTETIPDSIGENTANIGELSSITEEERTHIQETYTQVIQQTISDSLYTKQQEMTIQKDGIEYVTTAYRLDLSSQDVKNVVVQILQTLREDSITLNWLTTKAKLLGLGEEYTQVNQLTATIENWIEQINENENFAEGGLSLVVYTYQGETIQMEAIMGNTLKLTINSENGETGNSKINIQLENLSSEGDFSKIQLSVTINVTDAQTVIQGEMNIDDETMYTVNTTTTGTASQNNVNTITEFIMSQGGESWTINYTEQKNFVEEVENMVLLDNTNCAILNDYPTDQLQQLLTAITQRTMVVWMEKMQTINNYINPVPTVQPSGVQS